MATGRGGVLQAASASAASMPTAEQAITVRWFTSDHPLNWIPAMNGSHLTTQHPSKYTRILMNTDRICQAVTATSMTNHLRAHPEVLSRTASERLALSSASRGECGAESGASEAECGEAVRTPRGRDSSGVPKAVGVNPKGWKK